MGALSWKAKATGVIFGFLKSITAMKDDFQTDKVAFCFESPTSWRRELFPAYKQKRRTQQRSPEDQKAYENLKRQIHRLETEYLPAIGFKNIFSCSGMESDDVMAVLARRTPEDVVLVTADSDLYQCLRPNVSIYSPQQQKLLSIHWFRRTYGIDPKQWAIVKALAGCTTDGVPGIGKVGEITALKMVKARTRIQLTPLQRQRFQLNRQLVELPFLGCEVPPLSPDEISKENWLSVCHELGMRSLAGHPPITTKRLTRIDQQ